MQLETNPAGLMACDYQPRTRLLFGEGVVGRVGEIARELGGCRALLVTDSGLVRAGHPQRVSNLLRAAGVEVTIYDRVHENPTTLDVDQCLAVAREARVDLFVGLGGGSSMDTAKGTNFLLTNGGVMKDYWGVGKAAKPMLPLIAIPTTAGTGSECQSAALIADAHSHQKMACLDPKAAARVALLDPVLTLSLPPRVTACTGIDAIAHAVETAVTTRRNALSVMFSREGFTLCATSLERVLDVPGDVVARGRMLLGAAFAGTAIENSMLGAAHSTANPLTAHFDVVHGEAVGLMLPSVIRFNAAEPSVRRAYAELAWAAGIACVNEGEEIAIDALVARTEHLLNVAGMPRSLAGAGPGGRGVPRDAIPMLAREAAQQWTARFNPRVVDVSAFEQLYTAAFDERPSHIPRAD
jgi:alcohol dehydrogenase